MNADSLRVEFRKRFLAGLRVLHRKKKLNLSGPFAHLRSKAAFAAWLKPLESISWVTYIEKPPKESTPAQVLKYLARYMTGGPISDRRLVSHHDGIVTFKARAGKTHGGSDETEDVQLPGAEFVRRWCLHILPKNFTKSRRYGGYSPRHCKRYMAECRTLLSMNPATEPPAEKPATPPSSAECMRGPKCPACQIPMRCIAGADRPSWWTVMTSPLRPVWYDDA